MVLNLQFFLSNYLWKILTDRDTRWYEGAGIDQFFCVFKIFTCTINIHWYSTLQKWSYFDQVDIRPSRLVVVRGKFIVAFLVVILALTLDAVRLLPTLCAVRMLVILSAITAYQGSTITHIVCHATLETHRRFCFFLLDGVDILFSVCVLDPLLELEYWITQRGPLEPDSNNDWSS